MVDDNEAKRLGVDAAAALRSAARMLTDESIPYGQRLDAYRRSLIGRREAGESFVDSRGDNAMSQPQQPAE